jgi:hypothetical protein
LVLAEDGGEQQALPIAHGGGGLNLHNAELSEIEYDTSLTFSAKERGLRINSQTAEVRKARYFEEMKAKYLAQHPEETRRFEEFSQRGTGQWLTEPDRKFLALAYKAAFAHRFNVVNGDMQMPPSCPACRVSLTPDLMLAHLPACVCIPKYNASATHNRVRDTIVRYAGDAGYEVEAEPRDFESYTCTKCGESGLTSVRAEIHKGSCGISLHRSGPDVAITLGDGRHLYDVTICHGDCKSFRGISLKEDLDSRIAQKIGKYGPKGMALTDDSKFTALVLTSHGVLQAKVHTLIRMLSLEDEEEHRGSTLRALIQRNIQIGNGLAIASALGWLRNFDNKG